VTKQDKITICGPKSDGNYVVELSPSNAPVARSTMRFAQSAALAAG
jgi:hypothetical protein